MATVWTGSNNEGTVYNFVHESSEEDIKGVFEALDRNDDGSISRAELIRATRMDTDLREKLGLPSVVDDKDQNEFERVYQAMDVDGSKGVTFEEFAHFARRLSRGTEHISDFGQGPNQSAMLAIEGRPSLLPIAK